MKFKLSQILESTILLEGRREDVIKKYGEQHTDLVNVFVENDPSGNNKYLDWMVKTALENESVDSIIKVINDFHRLLPRIKNKDINSYKTLSDLKFVVGEAIEAEEEKQVSKQAKKIYEDEDGVIYAPFTVQASCKYGAGSKWCIAGKSDSRGLNTYFDEGLKLVKVFELRGVPTTIILNKNKEMIARISGSIDFEDEKFISWLNSIR